MTTLLEKALAPKVPSHRGGRMCPSQDEVELAVAFFQGRITTNQAARALGVVHQQSACQRMAVALRNACIAGMVTIEPKATP